MTTSQCIVAEPVQVVHIDGQDAEYGPSDLFDQPRPGPRSEATACSPADATTTTPNHQPTRE